MRSFLYVDNSNVWIEGMHAAAVQAGLAPDIWTAQREKICDYGWKLDFGRLYEFAGGDAAGRRRVVRVAAARERLPVEGRHRRGSRPTCANIR